VSEADTNASALADPPQRFLTKRFVCTLLIYFMSVVLVCSILMLSFSASMCYWNPHVACFSFSRHGGFLVAEVLRSWFPLALVAACLAAVAVRVLRAQKWWRDTAIALSAIVVTGLFAEAWAPARVTLLGAALHDSFGFVAEFVMLQLAFALSRLVVPRLCKAESWQPHRAA
jgi:hypothetical protein